MFASDRQTSHKAMNRKNATLAMVPEEMDVFFLLINLINSFIL